MLTKSDYERFAAEKQCVEQAVTMWKEWMSKQNGDRDERAAQGTVHVVHCMKLPSHQIALLHDFFDAYLSLLEYGEEQAEAFYKTVMRL